MVKDKKFYKLLFLIALPTAGQSLISLMVNMLDNIMVGNLGDNSLAAVSLANQVTMMLIFFLKGLTGGAAIFISQYWGIHNEKRIKQVTAIVFQLGMSITILVTTLIFIFPTHAMRIFTDNTAVMQEGSGYIRILCISYLFFAVSEILIVLMRCIETPRLGFITSLISLFINLALNYTLIFGKFGFPEMGVKGAAIATVICRIVEFCIVCIYVFKKDQKLHLRILDLFRFDFVMVKDFLRHGVPIIIADIQWGLVGMLKAIMIGHLSIVMVSANSIADTVFSLAYVFITGLSTGACVVIGKAVGSNDEKIKQYSNTIQIIFGCAAVFVCLLLLSIRNIVPTFYNVSDEVMTLASTFIGINAIISLGTGYHAACFTGINRGAGDSKFVMLVDCICGWLIVLPLTFLSGFVFSAPLAVVYLFTRCDQSFKWIIAFFRLRGDKWIHNVTRQE